VADRSLNMFAVKINSLIEYPGYLIPAPSQDSG
jgi:hypothetical protein